MSLLPPLFLPGMRHRTSRADDLRRLPGRRRSCFRGSERMGRRIMVPLRRRRISAGLAGFLLSRRDAGARAIRFFRVAEMNSLEILEQAVNLLRSAPLPAVLAYLTGAVPFSIALLFFLNDMNRSPFAFDHLAGASAGVAAMYIWKNIWQALFARKLYQTLSPEQPRASVLKLILFQAAVQPVGLALALPFPWLVAYFRNAALIAALGWPRPLRTARTQAVLWTKQNWGILALMTAGAMLLFANILLSIAVVPQLARSFLGIEGDLARLGERIVNLTTVAVAATLTWMVVDPLFDAVYALRVFYGESITSAEDLRAALRRAIAAAVLLVILIVPARAQVNPVQLDHSIDQVIHSREFTWRAPHPAEQPQGRWV